MAWGGKRDGAGRPKGAAGKITLAKAEAINREAKAKGIKLAHEVLSTAMNFFYGLSTLYQPLPSNPNRNEKLFHQYMMDSVDIAKALLPFQMPRLSSVTIQQLPLDLTRLTDQELEELERLHTKASDDSGDTGGAEPTQH